MIYVLKQKAIDENHTNIVGIIFNDGVKSTKLVRLGSNDCVNGIGHKELNFMFQNETHNYTPSLENKVLLLHTEMLNGRIHTINDTIIIDTNKPAQIMNKHINKDLLLLKTISSPGHILLQEDFRENKQDARKSIALSFGYNIKYKDPLVSHRKHGSIDFRIYETKWINRITIIDRNFQSQSAFDEIGEVLLLLEAPPSNIQYVGMKKAQRYRFISKVISFPLRNIKIHSPRYGYLHGLSYDPVIKEIQMIDSKGAYCNILVDDLDLI